MTANIALVIATCAALLLAVVGLIGVLEGQKWGGALALGAIGIAGGVLIINATGAVRHDR